MTRPACGGRFNRRGARRGRREATAADYTVAVELREDVPIGEAELTAIERLLGSALDDLLRDVRLSERPTSVSKP